MILDTSFLIDLRHGERGAVRLAREFEGAPVLQRVSVVSVFELYTGVAQTGNEESEHRAVLDVIHTKEIVPVDWPVAAKAGRLHGELVKGGNRLDVRDCLVAATALHHEEPVVTRDEDHFDRIDGLRVRTY